MVTADFQVGSALATIVGFIFILCLLWWTFGGYDD